MDRCVYLHKDNSGKVFYVGQGSLERAYQMKKARSKLWFEAAKNGVFVEIVKTGLSKTQAIEIEDSLIKKYDGLVNKISTKVKNIDFEYFNEWFMLDSSSETGIVWKKDNNSNSPVNRKYKGDVAGFVQKRPCGKPSGFVVSLFSKKYQVHRVIWVLHGKQVDTDMVIDHIDGNPKNNNIDNLRQVYPVLNARNLTIRHDNVSGVSGVQVDLMSGTKYYVATWYEYGKQKRKAFSVKRYGETHAFEMAIEYRKNAIKSLNERGCGFVTSRLFENKVQSNEV